MTNIEKHNATKLEIYVEDFFEFYSQYFEKYYNQSTCKTEDFDVKVRLDDFASLFNDISDEARIELVKSLIWTAPSQETMLDKVSNLVASKKFRETID